METPYQLGKKMKLSTINLALSKLHGEFEKCLNWKSPQEYQTCKIKTGSQNTLPFGIYNEFFTYKMYQNGKTLIKWEFEYIWKLHNESESPDNKFKIMKIE